MLMQIGKPGLFDYTSAIYDTLLLDQQKQHILLASFLNKNIN